MLSFRLGISSWMSVQKIFPSWISFFPQVPSCLERTEVRDLFCYQFSSLVSVVRLTRERGQCLQPDGETDGETRVALHLPHAQLHASCTTSCYDQRK